jgi:hypothetical protein
MTDDEICCDDLLIFIQLTMRKIAYRVEYCHGLDMANIGKHQEKRKITEACPD